MMTRPDSLWLSFPEVLGGFERGHHGSFHGVSKLRKV
jgi:hypothetical protein